MDSECDWVDTDVSPMVAETTVHEHLPLISGDQKMFANLISIDVPEDCEDVRESGIYGELFNYEVPCDADFDIESAFESLVVKSSPYDADCSVHFRFTVEYDDKDLPYVLICPHTDASVPIQSPDYNRAAAISCSESRDLISLNLNTFERSADGKFVSDKALVIASKYYHGQFDDTNGDHVESFLSSFGIACYVGLYVLNNFLELTMDKPTEISCRLASSVIDLQPIAITLYALGFNFTSIEYNLPFPQKFPSYSMTLGDFSLERGLTTYSNDEMLSQSDNPFNKVVMEKMLFLRKLSALVHLPKCKITNKLRRIGQSIPESGSVYVGSIPVSRQFGDNKCSMRARGIRIPKQDRDTINNAILYEFLVSMYQTVSAVSDSLYFSTKYDEDAIRHDFFITSERLYRFTKSFHVAATSELFKFFGNIYDYILNLACSQRLAYIVSVKSDDGTTRRFKKSATRLGYDKLGELYAKHRTSSIYTLPLISHIKDIPEIFYMAHLGPAWMPNYDNKYEDTTELYSYFSINFDYFRNHVPVMVESPIIEQRLFHLIANDLVYDTSDDAYTLRETGTKVFRSKRTYFIELSLRAE